jgi:hypothetical protein
MFQKQVETAQALGVAGHIAQGRGSYFNTISGICADDKVEVGYFVQRGDKEGEFKGVRGVAVEKVAGVAIFDNFQSANGSSDVKAKGANVTVLNEGSVFIEAQVVAKAGQFVFVKNDDGRLAFDNTNTKANHTLTGFVVVKGNGEAKRGVIEISTAGAR